MLARIHESQIFGYDDNSLELALVIQRQQTSGETGREAKIPLTICNDHSLYTSKGLKALEDVLATFTKSDAVTALCAYECKLIMRKNKQ